MTHIVNRLCFELRCPDEGTAFLSRQAFAETFQPEIVEIIDKVCSQYLSEEEWLRLDTLEIDLGRFSQHLLDRDFALLFRRQFEKELLKKLDLSTIEQRKVTKERSRMELFAYFLLQGTLPWWAVETEADIDTLARELYLRHPAGLRSFFYEQRKNPTLWTRAAFQLSDTAIRAIISLFRELQDAERLLSQWALTSNILDVRFSVALRQALLRHAPELFSEGEVVPPASDILSLIVNEIVPKLTGAMTSPASITPGAPWSIAENASVEVSAVPLTPGASDREASHSLMSSGRVLTHAEFESDKEQARYPLHHAGLILLAPFFMKLFDACGLLDGRQWKDKEAQYQAIHLLGFLSTGSTKVPEYSLVLEKICCGIAIEEPIPLDAGLQEYQLDESRALLASVIEHWKVLKNTSIDGLRETFLKRDGLLSVKEEGWLLQVERKTLDVLLDSLPWGYSTVLLPWNDYHIHVEW
ncbi:MAG: hypothetical protein FDX18_11150 [Chlorobium sp.]|nr:MAG: hypothetical protein FDX18_11150 [Chlorobium sp.]